jgi:hypothetical protein
VLWAGKLDYWLVGAPVGGGTAPAWPSLCRFDGVNYQWEPLSVPKATIAKVLRATGAATGAIASGSCFAWNNCWFFGTGGAVVHWDGQTLTDASVGLGQSPWLTGEYTDATAATAPDGQPFGIAVAAANAGQAQPDGAPAPQLFSSAGQAYAPTTFTPGLPAGDSTDLVSVAFDANGDGWVAGDPAGVVEPPGVAAPGPSFTTPFPLGNHDRQPSPLVPISSSGSALNCPATPSNSFMYSGQGAQTSYLWSSIAVMPGGTAIAGGVVGQIPSGSLPVTEPVLAQVSCTESPRITRFRVPDPNAPGSTIAANQGGYTTAVAANSVNDVWAASAGGSITVQGSSTAAPPHLYLLTDGQAPLAPAGDDNESRPVVFQQQPTIFEFPPPVVIPPPPAATTSTKTLKPKHKTVKLPAAVYDIQHPKLQAQPNGSFRLSISFKVRRKVVIGLEALHGKQVISSSGLKTFSGPKGTLAVTVSRSHWPTGLKFIQPRGHK